MLHVFLFHYSGLFFLFILHFGFLFLLDFCNLGNFIYVAMELSCIYFKLNLMYCVFINCLIVNVLLNIADVMESINKCSFKMWLLLIHSFFVVFIRNWSFLIFKTLGWLYLTFGGHNCNWCCSRFRSRYRTASSTNVVHTRERQSHQNKARKLE